MNYTVVGQAPPPSAGKPAETLNERFPGASVGFKVDEQLQQLFDRSPLRDDHIAREEWAGNTKSTSKNHWTIS